MGGYPPQGSKADLTTLETRLSADRAALLDNLLSIETRLSADRAALLDNLLSIETTGTITHPAGIIEQDSLEITPTELTEYAIVLLDFNALTQNITIRTYIKIDGINHRFISSAVFPTDFPANAEGVPIELYPMSVDWKITLQSVVTEGVSRDIPYRYVRRSLV